MKKIFSVVLIIFFLIPLTVMGDDFYNDNLVFIMDCSGSMSGEKIEQAKSALKEVLKHVPATTHIGLLSFGETEGWRYPLGPRDEIRLNKAINDLRTGGSTPLGEYMKNGTERLLKQRQQQLGYGTYRLLVITDGEATDPDLVDTYTPEIMARGVTIDVIGVFMDKKHSLSKMVHSYREAQDTASLKKAITEVLAEIGDQSDGAATVDAFAEIGGLPDEMVPKVIKAISSSPDRPLELAAKKKYSPQARSTVHRKQPQKTKREFPVIVIFWIVFAVIIFFQVFKRKR